MRRETALFFLLALTAAPLCAQEAAPTPRDLFVKHCAQCHGENGDGNGVQKLDKPARSFKDGGFSYGNTPEALLRTITFGIPGTPMPSFANALTDAQKKELATYVITLGPEVVEVKASETRLVVKDVPLFVRGKLPPIVDGAKETVRGLLVGTPDGFTFEYDVEDVRLLGVRQGDFVERRDWGGRGGDALQPLGKVVYDAGARSASSAVTYTNERNHRSGPVSAVFLGTRARSDGAHVASVLQPRLVDRESPSVRMDERVSAAQSAIGAGFARTFAFEVQDVGDWDWGRFEFLVGEAPGAVLEARGAGWCVRKLVDGRRELTRLSTKSSGVELVSEGATARVRIPSARVAGLAFEVVTLLLPAWNAEVEAAWKQEFAR
ncbi:MAG: c-type cytochrome [Planctomycetes bacterium]|nr:c-type cytochrome [Planctomycetota bacterium]